MNTCLIDRLVLVFHCLILLLATNTKFMLVDGMIIEMQIFALSHFSCKLHLKECSFTVKLLQHLKECARLKEIMTSLATAFMDTAAFVWLLLFVYNIITAFYQYYFIFDVLISVISYQFPFLYLGGECSFYCCSLFTS